MEGVDFGDEGLTPQGGVDADEQGSEEGGNTGRRSTGRQPGQHGQVEEGHGDGGQKGAEGVEAGRRVAAEKRGQMLPASPQQQIERVACGVGQAKAPGCKLEFPRITEKETRRKGAAVESQKESKEYNRQPPVQAKGSGFVMACWAGRFDRCFHLIDN